MQEQIQIVSDSGVIVSISVIEVRSSDLGDALGAARNLLFTAAEADQDFIAGALHASLRPFEQPLAWVPGFVPLGRRMIAIYAQWRASGHCAAFAGLPVVQHRLSALKAFRSNEPCDLFGGASDLYEPALLDATGELCPDQEDCADGRDVGPIIAVDSWRAGFINVFETTPDRQDGLLAATYAIMPVARKHHGYLRTALHRSKDGKKVANYGQYRTFADIRRMYFYIETARRFAAVAFSDVTKPTQCFGRNITFFGRTLGSTPRLRCYGVDTVLRRLGSRSLASSGSR